MKEAPRPLWFAPRGSSFDGTGRKSGEMNASERRASSRERPFLKGLRGAPDDVVREVVTERLRYFQKILAMFHGGLFVLGLVVVGFFPAGSYRQFLPSFVANLVITVTLVGLSRVLSRSRPGMRALAVLDVTTVLMVTGVVAALSHFMPPTLSIGLQVVGTTVNSTLMLRSAIVPSRPGRTMFIGVLTNTLTFVLVGPAKFVVALGNWVTPPVVLVAFALHTLLTACITAATSKIIYGLHERIQTVVRMGQYALIDKIGEGGMGSVWRAQHAMLRRPTAVKLLAEDRTTEVDLVRFEREVQLTSLLTHPNTVAVFDYGRAEDGTLYYAMEYVDGLSLEELVERHGPMPPGRVIRVLSQVTSALVEAHAMGLIHRDIKPANILLCVRGAIPDFVKVVDFGLVKMVLPDRTDVSTANAIAGTPPFMSPETITSAEDADGRADLYALGAVGYYLLTGRNVFEGTNLIEICSHHLHTKPMPPSAHAEVPALLEDVVLECLAKRPEDRPANAGALLKRLEACALEAPWCEEEAAEFWRAHRRSSSPGGERLRTFAKAHVST